MFTDDEIIAEIADRLPFGVWVARAPGGEFVFANEKFREIMGMPGLEDVARGDYAEPYKIHARDGSLYPEEQMPFVRALIERQTVMIDDIVIHADGDTRTNIRAYAQPLFEGDDITHVIIAFFDISREVRAEDANREAQVRMQQVQRMESLGNLAGGVAHDFNNLLGAMKLMLDTLRLDDQDPSRRARLEALDEVTDKATNLTEDLLAFAGRGKNLDAPTSMNRVIESLRNVFDHALDKRIEVELDLRATRDVMGDYSRLELSVALADVLE